jgi:hypothetical protein
MVKIQVMVLWIVALCSIAVGYQCFGELCCLHYHDEVNGTGRKGPDIGRECKREGRVCQPIGSRMGQSGSQWEAGKDSDTSSRRPPPLVLHAYMYTFPHPVPFTSP